MKKYIIVKNQHGQFAVQKTNTGLILCAGEPLEKCEARAAEWNLAEESVWKPINKNETH